jgi:hypothetical protein
LSILWWPVVEAVATRKVVEAGQGASARERPCPSRLVQITPLLLVAAARQLEPHTTSPEMQDRILRLAPLQPTVVVKAEIKVIRAEMVVLEAAAVAAHREPQAAQATRLALLRRKAIMAEPVAAVLQTTEALVVVEPAQQEQTEHQRLVAMAVQAQLRLFLAAA